MAQNIYWLVKRVSAAAIIEVYSTTYLLTEHTDFQPHVDWAERFSRVAPLRWETQPFPAIYRKPSLQSAANGAITRLGWKYLLLSLIYLNTGRVPSWQNAAWGNYSRGPRVIVSK